MPITFKTRTQEHPMKQLTTLIVVVMSIAAQRQRIPGRQSAIEHELPLRIRPAQRIRVALAAGIHVAPARNQLLPQGLCLE